MNFPPGRSASAANFSSRHPAMQACHFGINNGSHLFLRSNILRLHFVCRWSSHARQLWLRRIDGPTPLISLHVMCPKCPLLFSSYANGHTYHINSLSLNSDGEACFTRLLTAVFLLHHGMVVDLHCSACCHYIMIVSSQARFICRDQVKPSSLPTSCG